MFNTSQDIRTNRLPATTTLVGVYVAIVVATIGALAILSSTGSHQATSDAWVHAVVVAVFAVLLPVRLRAARRGSETAIRAVGLIAMTLLVVNVVEAAIPDVFPTWMRLEMLAIAALMAAIGVTVRRARR